MLYNRKSEASSAELPVPCLIGAIESFKDPRQIARWNSRSLIRHTQAEPFALARGPDDDDDATDERDRGDEEHESCASVSQKAESHRQPVDILFVIDNSTSMTDEIESVRNRINDDFARIISESDVDYRVILISRYNDAQPAVPVEPASASASTHR